MRFNLIDLLIAIFFMTMGTVVVSLLPPRFSCCPPLAAGLFLGTGLYLAVVAPIYRRFRLFPMILPRCPCCGKLQQGFFFTHGWPRVIYKCPTCTGEFVIWLNGEPGDTETWDRPVLALKWPYALGRYQRMTKE